MDKNKWNKKETKKEESKFTSTGKLEFKQMEDIYFLAGKSGECKYLEICERDMTTLTHAWKGWGKEEAFSWYSPK